MSLFHMEAEEEEYLDALLEEGNLSELLKSATKSLTADLLTEASAAAVPTESSQQSSADMEIALDTPTTTVIEEVMETVQKTVQAQVEQVVEAASTETTADVTVQDTLRTATVTTAATTVSFTSQDQIQALLQYTTRLKHHLGYGWYVLLVLTSCMAFVIGLQFVKYLRNCCKMANRSKHLTTAIFVTPISVFVFLSTLVFFGILERGIADALSFGIVAGIIVQLSRKPKGPGSVKLIAVQSADNKTVDVWLDSTKLTVGEVRSKIAEELEVHPSSRIAIESGKGSFLDDLSTPFFPLIDESLKTTDFFGFVTVLCYIFVKEEEKKRVSIMEEAVDGTGKEKQDKKNKFLSMLQQKPEVKYGESLSFLSKIASDTKSNFNFNVSCVDKFGAAAPATMQILNSAVVRMQSWDAITSEVDGTEGVSDAGDAMSVSSSNTKSNTGKSPKGFFRKRKHPESLKYGKPVCHGDMVVLECSGKYMSVARGWWMAWSSSEPRRSGAFIVEIIEKASQTNKLKEQLKESIENIKENFKEKIVRPGQVIIGQNQTTNSSNTLSPSRELVHSNSFHSGSHTNHHEVDNILRPGDIFRLRSVKFPDFELGLTSVKIRDEYCYLGLRKINGATENVEDESWCMEMLFTVKPTNEIFKI